MKLRTPIPNALEKAAFLFVVVLSSVALGVGAAWHWFPRGITLDRPEDPSVATMNARYVPTATSTNSPSVTAESNIEGYIRWLADNAERNDASASVVATMAVGDVLPVDDCHLSGPYTHNNLTVFLIHGRETLEKVEFLTLDEALRDKKAIMHETGSVNQLTIENQSTSAEVFIQSGDIIKGGKQDRTLPYDSIIEANSGQVPINSYCVEHGRWSQRGGESAQLFSSSSNSVGTSELKQIVAGSGISNLPLTTDSNDISASVVSVVVTGGSMARAAYGTSSMTNGQSQSNIWQNVSRTQEKLSKKLGEQVKATDSTSSLQLTLESPAVRNAIAPYLALGSIVDKQNDVVGYVAVVNGKVVSADVYASRPLFRKLWPKLLEGSAVEAFI
jgi:hypothetical protein